MDALAPQTLLELSGIGRSFDGGSVRALRGIDLTISPGEFVAIIGRSGSGKSSLLNIMGGIDLATEGRVRWKGEVLADQSAWTSLRRREIGIIFQEFLLLPTLTAAENVEVAMSGTGMPLAAQRRRAADLLARVGLGARAGHQPHQLSGGERQRVAIARSIANRPELLLCDEPTGNLDSDNAKSVMDLLMSIRADDGMALVLVTHDQDLARMASRRIVLRDGHVETPTGVAA